jgi:copper chaperone
MPRFSVPDMSCNHCKTSILSALTALPDAGPVSVDLALHVVTTGGPATPAAIIAALDAIGYAAEPVAQV